MATDPPVATMFGFCVTFSVESLTVIQPSTESTKTKVTDCPCVPKTALAFTPPNLSDPLGTIVKGFVLKLSP